MKEEIMINCNDEEVKLTIHYCGERGAAEQVILFVHGFGGDSKSSVIKDITQALQPKNIAVVTFDLPCHGENNYGMASFSVKNALGYIGTIEEHLLNMFHVKTINYFSNSYGAYLTLLHFKNTNNHVSKAILRAPAILMPKLFEHKILNFQGVTLSKFETNQVATLGYGKKMQVPYSFYTELKENDIFNYPFLNAIYICQGDQDPVIDLNDIKAFAAKNKKSVALEVFEGSNHSIKHPHEMPRLIEIVKTHFNI